MKRLLYLASIIVLAFTAGCILSGDEKNDEQPDARPDESLNETAEKYYPMKVGASWTYEATVSKISDTDTTYTDTYAIIDTVIFDDLRYYVEKRTIGGYGELSLYLRTAGNILYGVDPDQNGEELSYLNFNLSLGESWYPTATVMKETFTGIIDVEVPAGTFRDCMKFHAEGIAIENNMLVKNVIKEYYAADVGRVKSVIIKSDADETVIFSENTVLKSYVIPE